MESDNEDSEGQDAPAPRRGGLLPPIKSTPPEQRIHLPGNGYLCLSGNCLRNSPAMIVYRKPGRVAEAPDKF